MKRLFLLLLPALLIGCPDSGLDANASVSLDAPIPSTIESADTLSLRATVTGSTRQGVIWSASAGSITPGGLFTPPDETTAVTVTVTSQANPQSQATTVIGVTRSARLTGSLFWDANKSGQRDPLEPLLASWQVYLDLNDNGAMDAAEPRAFSDASGQYSLVRLRAGTYRLRYAGHLGYGAGVAVQAAPVLRPQIVGGSAVNDARYNFTAALLFSASLDAAYSDPYVAQFCGGSLIAPGWVLTAAHCVKDDMGATMPTSSLEVAVGFRRLENPLARLAVTQVLPHPGYNSNTSDNDIALLRLASPVNSLAVAPLEAAQSALAGSGITASIIGWGALREDAKFPADYPIELRAATLPIVDQSTCQAAYSSSITARMLCAGYAKGGVDTCQGDSGGPLTVTADGAPLLAGVTSFGKGCAEPGVPGVYSRVSSFTPWLEAALGRGPDGASDPITLAVGQSAGVSFAVRP